MRKSFLPRAGATVCDVFRAPPATGKAPMGRWTLARLPGQLAWLRRACSGAAMVRGGARPCVSYCMKLELGAPLCILDFIPRRSQGGLHANLAQNRLEIATVEDKLERGDSFVKNSEAVNPDGLCPVIPRSEKEGMKPPYVCLGCSNHMYSNNMITRFHVQ
jgi:hypothetical protein